MTEYERFSDSVSMAHDNILTPSSQVQIVTSVNDEKVKEQTKKVAHYVKILWYLCLSQFCIAILVTLFGATCFINMITLSRHYVGMCFTAEGLWIGVLLIISSLFGLGAVWRGKKIRHNCLFIAYFVCSIIVCIFITGLLIISSIYASVLNNVFRSTRYDGIDTAFVMNLLLVIMPSLFMITCLISLELICSTWSVVGCCNTAPLSSATVVFVPTQNGDANEQLLTIASDVKGPVTIVIQGSNDIVCKQDS